MSTNDPYDPAQDADRTMLVPTPGGRRAAQPAPASAATPAGMAVPASVAALELHGSSLNPLVRAANPLLDLVVPLRFMPSYAHLEELRQQLLAALKRFEDDARAQNIPTEKIAAARYALCTFLDETISSTPWGSGGVWASRSLLVALHNEAWGGEKFFLILQRLSQDARANVDVLELMYVCLALGLEGRYRVLDNGRAQLDTLRERLQQLIQSQHGPVEADLSPHWQGAAVAPTSLLRLVPIWVLAAVAATILLVLHLFFSFSLSGASDPVYAGLRRIQVVAAAAPAQAPPSVPAPAPVARVAGFLAPEIAQGLVSVTETADRSTITLRGDGVFGSGKAEVEPAFLPLLGRIGDALKPVPGKVIVIGHTDNTKAGFGARYPSNYDLSKARAGAVLQLLAERAGPPQRYSLDGRGDTEPLVANDTPANRARNRRVDIVVLTPAVAP